MGIYEIIKKLIGSISPCGDTNIDEKRLYNLDIQIDVAYAMLKDIIEVAKYKDSYESSVSNMGNMAYEYLVEFKKMIDDATI